MSAGAARIDGRQKVTGDARYGSDFAPGALAWAFLKTSEIAKGRIVDIDERAARAVPGVLEVLSYRNVGEQVRPGKLVQKGFMGSTMQPLRNEQVLYAGQIVAVVIADTFEGAREAARRLTLRYAVESPAAGRWLT